MLVQIMDQLPLGATEYGQPRAAAAFKDWMHANGFDDSKCSVHNFPGTGRGARAACNIKKGEVVLQVCLAVVQHTWHVQANETRACARVRAIN